MKKDNKGFSLVEVLIVMAITSIVMLLATSLIVNSSRIYTREADIIDVQNEAQLIVNNLNQAIMEATKLEASEDAGSGSLLVKFGEYEIDSTTTPPTVTSKSKSYCRHLYFQPADKFLGMIVNSVYLDKLVSEFPGLSGDDLEQLKGYQLSSYVSDFKIVADPSCIGPDIIVKEVVGGVEQDVTKKTLKNPVKVTCSFTITTVQHSYNYEMSVQLRNSLKTVTIEDPNTGNIETFLVRNH